MPITIRPNPIGLLMLSAALYVQAALPAGSETVNVYRCTGTDGKTSLQDTPCTAGSTQEIIRMRRPADAPPAARPSVPAPSLPAAAPPVPPAIARRPPPDLFQCTDFEGNVRDSESNDGNPRCVPLWVQGYRVASNVCSWVVDSCVRYEGRALCDRWRERLRQAELDVRHSPSGQVAFRRSEVARMEQIVRSSCR